MATTTQMTAARRNLEKARQARSARAHGAKKPGRSPGLSTAQNNDLPASAFACGKARKR